LHCGRLLSSFIGSDREHGVFSGGKVPTSFPSLRPEADSLDVLLWKRRSYPPFFGPSRSFLFFHQLALPSVIRCIVIVVPFLQFGTFALSLLPVDRYPPGTRGRDLSSPHHPSLPSLLSFPDSYHSPRCRDLITQSICPHRRTFSSLRSRFLFVFGPRRRESHFILSPPLPPSNSQASASDSRTFLVLPLTPQESAQLTSFTARDF